MAPPVELIPWHAQPGPQLYAIQKHWVSELFFGGAVGGGKSDYLLGDFAQDVPEYGAHWHGILFRKSYPQLEELVMRSKMIYPAWFGFEAKDCWTSGDHTWRFPNGSTLKFRHAEDDDAWMYYQGHAYGWMAYDELPHWANPTFYRQMKTRVRNGAMAIPNKRIRATGNPGGPGHGWIKKYWKIDSYPHGSVLIPKDREGGNRMFVKSSVKDNKILLANDPEYIERLQGLGSETLVQMYLEGRWDIIAGAFFPEFDPGRHVIAPMEIPKHWMKFRSMDWGSAKPFSVGWYAVSDGCIDSIPRGALVKYREWYGMKDGEMDVGLKLTAEEVADGIKSRERADEDFSMSVADPAAWKEDGGPSIIQRMARQAKVYFSPADNARKPGWDALRARLKGDPRDGRPMIYFFSTCPDTIRTLPELQHDTGKAAGAMEDVDTHSEDHAGDETRYACMSRPWVRPGSPGPAPKPQANGLIQVNTTFAELVEQSRRARLAHDIND